MHFLGKMRPRFVKRILVCASYNLRIYSYPKWGHSSLHFTLYHYLLLHVLSLTFRGLESSNFCQLMYLKLGLRICWHQSRSPRQNFTLFFWNLIHVIQCQIFDTKRPRIIKASQLMHYGTCILQCIRQASCFQTIQFCYLCNLKHMQYMNTDLLNILNIEYPWKMRQYIVSYQFWNNSSVQYGYHMQGSEPFISLREQYIGFLYIAGFF